MNTSPLFKQTITYKVFVLTGVLLVFFFLFGGILIRFFDIPVFHVILLIVGFSLFAVALLYLFVWYVSKPLEAIAVQILNLLTGKKYEKIPPMRNDEIGVVTHFFNTVSDKIQDLSSELSAGKRMAGELELASKIQSQVLPKSAPDNILGLEIVAASKASSEIGGDSFDFISSGDNTLMYIGDVTGHGVPAGLVMMVVSTTVRLLAQEGMSPKNIISKTNAILKEKITTNHFMSFVMLQWNNRQQKMSFIGAGHEYILHYSKKENKVHAIKSGGIALKMIPDISAILQEKDIYFEEGDALCLYTDGITEAKNKKGEMYDLSRLQMVFLQHATKKPSIIFDKITEDFSAFLGPDPHQEDDITLIIIKNIGQHEQTQKVELRVQDATKEKIYSKFWNWD
jgi:serine phosphatase RsbU (regulator of sigma subunit)